MQSRHSLFCQDNIACLNYATPIESTCIYIKLSAEHCIKELLDIRRLGMPYLYLQAVMH